MAINTQRFVKALRFTSHFILDDPTDQIIPKVGAGSVIGDAISAVKWNNIPQVTISSDYNVQKADVGKHILINGGYAGILSGVFAAGDVFVLVNNTLVNKSIVIGSGASLYWPNGTASPGTGSRTLTPFAMASVLCLGANVFVITGQGVL